MLLRACKCSSLGYESYEAHKSDDKKPFQAPESDRKGDDDGGVSTDERVIER